MKYFERKNLLQTGLALGALLLVYLTTRLLYLESDIPSWSMSSYSPIDEMYYTHYAFQLFRPLSAPFAQFAQSDFFPYNLFENWLTYISLEVFGNNFYGLRFPSVVMGLGVTVGLFQILKKRFGIFSAILGSILLLTNFGFILSNRVAEPTIFRMLVSILIIGYCIKVFLAYKLTPKQAFKLGLAGIIAVLFVYPTNFFILPAMLCLITSSNKAVSFKEIRNLNIWFFLGALTGTLLYLLVLKLMSIDIIAFFEMSSIFNKRLASSTFSIIQACKNVWFNFKAIGEASYFKFDKYFLILAITSAIGCCARLIFLVYRKQRLHVVDKVVFVLGFLFLIQSGFLNDYPQRKLIFLLPFVIYSLFFFSNFIFQKSKVVGYAAITILIFPVIWKSSSLAYEQIYKKPTFYYKTAMTQFLVNPDELIVGGFSFGFRLYNNYTTMVNKYNYVYSNPARYDEILSELFQKYCATVLDYDREEEINFYAKFGYRKKQLIFKSNDGIYPDIVRYGGDCFHK